MHAVVEISGKQFTVRAEERVRVPLLNAEAGTEVEFDQVLLVADGENHHVGMPRVEGARVVATLSASGHTAAIVGRTEAGSGMIRLR